MNATLCLPKCSICREGSYTAHEFHPDYHVDENDLRSPARPSDAPIANVLSRVLGGRCTTGDEFDDVAEERQWEQSKLVHETMMTFVRTLLRGICIEVLLDDGSALFPEVSLNYELTHLTMDVNEAQRSIPLEDVEDVVSPEELEQRKILQSIGPFLDERCCTLIIRGCEFVTFRFDTSRLREYFSTCLTLLIARGEDCREELALKDGSRLLGGASGPRPGPRALPAQTPGPVSEATSEAVTQEATIQAASLIKSDSSGLV